MNKYRFKLRHVLDEQLDIEARDLKSAKSKLDQMSLSAMKIATKTIVLDRQVNEITNMTKDEVEYTRQAPLHVPAGSHVSLWYRSFSNGQYIVESYPTEDIAAEAAARHVILELPDISDGKDIQEIESSFRNKKPWEIVQLIKREYPGRIEIKSAKVEQEPTLPEGLPILSKLALYKALTARGATVTAKPYKLTDAEKDEIDYCEECELDEPNCECSNCEGCGEAESDCTCNDCDACHKNEDDCDCCGTCDNTKAECDCCSRCEMSAEDCDCCKQCELTSDDCTCCTECEKTEETCTCCKRCEQTEDDCDCCKRCDSTESDCECCKNCEETAENCSCCEHCEQTIEDCECEGEEEEEEDEEEEDAPPKDGKRCIDRNCCDKTFHDPPPKVRNVGYAISDTNEQEEEDEDDRAEVIAVPMTLPNGKKVFRVYNEMRLAWKSICLILLGHTSDMSPELCRAFVLAVKEKRYEAAVGLVTSDNSSAPVLQGLSFTKWRVDQEERKVNQELRLQSDEMDRVLSRPLTGDIYQLTVKLPGKEAKIVEFCQLDESRTALEQALWQEVPKLDDGKKKVAALLVSESPTEALEVYEKASEILGKKATKIEYKKVR